MLALDILLQLVGAFYMLAGIVLARAVMFDRMLTRMADAISPGAANSDTRDRARAAYSLVLAAMTFLSGLGLMSLCDVAVYLFIANMLLQAVFLFWVAPQYLDKADASQSKGRQQSTNALVVYSAATAFVTWAGSIGRLQPMAEASPLSLAMTASLAAVYFGYVAWMFVRWRIRRPR